VRRNGALSDVFKVTIIISPYLFIVFNNKLTMQLISAKLGFYIDSAYVGCIFHTDDILLLSTSVDCLKKCSIFVPIVVMILVLAVMSLNPYA
jgi:hypothetical protein